MRTILGLAIWALMLLATLAVWPSVTLAAQPTPYRPDPALTPGAWRTDLTVQQICATKWGHDARAVTAAMKMIVFREYGYPLGNKDPRCPCEIDHLVSRELSGADDLRNLWVQSYRGPWNARFKDRLENRLHVELCAGKITLDAARHALIDDWTAAYRARFGDPPQ